MCKDSRWHYVAETWQITLRCRCIACVQTAFQKLLFQMIRWRHFRRQTKLFGLPEGKIAVQHFSDDLQLNTERHLSEQLSKLDLFLGEKIYMSSAYLHYADSDAHIPNKDTPTLTYSSLCSIFKLQTEYTHVLGRNVCTSLGWSVYTASGVQCFYLPTLPSCCRDFSRPERSIATWWTDTWQVQHSQES